jgi:hypothetical protein
VISDQWKHSTHCSYGDCVEVRSVSTEFFGDMVEIRSSTKKSLVLRFTRDEWDAFLDGVRSNEFGL